MWPLRVDLTNVVFEVCSVGNELTLPVSVAYFIPKTLPTLGSFRLLFH